MWFSGRRLKRKCCLLIIKWPWTSLALLQALCHLNGWTAWLAVGILQQPGSRYRQKSSSKPCACACKWKRPRVIKLPNDCQLVEQTRQPYHDASPGGVYTNMAISINETVSMLKIEQEDWVEEGIDNGMVGMLNIQFNNLVADKESDLCCLKSCNSSSAKQ